jgi:hypothetical protein
VEGHTRASGRESLDFAPFRGFLRGTSLAVGRRQEDVMEAFVVVVATLAGVGIGIGAGRLFLGSLLAYAFKTRA